jgi:hydrogenase expression/formation protein HypE
VEPALLAARLGATSLHDPTEGGLAAGRQEVALASGVRLEIDPTVVLWFEPGCAVCKALGADPWSTLASGSLLATFPVAIAREALAALRGQGYPATAIGTTAVGTGVHDLSGHPLRSSRRDEVARVLAVSPERASG